MISTLRKTVEAMGGTLSLVAEFPDREPVVLSGIRAYDALPRAKNWRLKRIMRAWSAS